jgi:uncharacterized membrane protein YgdD (TMEM256/DUF423 family)
MRERIQRAILVTCVFVGPVAFLCALICQAMRLHDLAGSLMMVGVIAFMGALAVGG